MRKIVRHLFILVLSLFSLTVSAQNAKKMAKYLKVVKTDDYDPTISFTFKPIDSDRAGIIEALKNAFVSQGLTVLSETSISEKYLKKKTESHPDNGTKITTESNESNNYVKSQYLVTVSYFWEYTNYAGIQCRNIRGQIVDLANNSKIVATFNYGGYFNIEPTTNAIAVTLSKKRK